jgi:sporulation protein YlmC with PRC-barrel domain
VSVNQPKSAPLSTSCVEEYVLGRERGEVGSQLLSCFSAFKFVYTREKYIQNEEYCSVGACVVDVDKLKGKTVIDTKAYTLGEVSGAEVDTENWEVTHLRVKLTDAAATELGLKKRFRSSTVNLPITLIAAVGDVISINKPIQELRDTSDITESKD